jgi:chromosomal replication initiation ATPase DnaA
MKIMKIIEKNIVKIVAEVCNVKENKIIRNRRSTRHSNVVLARQILVNILFRNFNYTNHMVKDVLKYKNHASVVHARNMHDTDYKCSEGYRGLYNKSMDMLGLYVNYNVNKV